MALKENFPTVDVTKLIGLYQQRKNAQLMDELHKILNVVEHRQFTNIGREDQQKIDRLVSIFLFIFAQPDFFIPNEHVVKLIQRNHLFANLLQLSSYKTSDAVIETIANHEYNLFKILFLWTVYNKLSLDPDILFKTNKPLASIWWMNYLSPLPGTTSEFLYNSALKENFPTVDVTKLIGLYQQRKNTQLMDELHKILNVVEHRQFTTIGREDQQKIDRLVSVFLFIFAQPDFFIPNEHVVKLIQRNHLFANLLQLSSYKTSDAVIETIANHEYNLFKILFLWTAYNKLSLDPEILFKTNKPLASIWWMNYLSPLPGTTSEFLYNAARETLANLPDLELA